MNNQKSPQTVFYIFSLAAFVLFVALGCWQLQRLQEKETMLAPMRMHEIASIYYPPQPLSRNLEQYRNYTYTVRSGSLDQTKPVFRPGTLNPYPSSNPEERLGYDLYLPLTEGKQAILVNFGWVDLGMRNRIAENAKSGKVQPIPVTISGWLLPPQNKKTFTPDNNPAANEWYWQDWPALAAYTGYQFLPFILYNDVNWYGTARPVLWQQIPNNHLQYAFTWFGLALVQLVASIVYYCKSRRES